MARSPVGVALKSAALAHWVQRCGGVLRGAAGADPPPDGILLQWGCSLVERSEASSPPSSRGVLCPFTHARLAAKAHAALRDGAVVLTSPDLWQRYLAEAGGLAWCHPRPTEALASLLSECGEAPSAAPVIGEGCRLGQGVVLGPGVVLGDRVVVGANSVIGAPGFGWSVDEAGEPRRVPQLGGVVIERDVEIGALCTIDAGTLGPTRIGEGSKIDAQVHIGHNVRVGRRVLVAAQSGFAGSVTVDDDVRVGGQVGVADHVHVGARAVLLAKSGVTGDVAPGEVVGGYPAMPRWRWLRGVARMLESR